MKGCTGLEILWRFHQSCRLPLGPPIQTRPSPSTRRPTTRTAPSSFRSPPSRRYPLPSSRMRAARWPSHMCSVTGTRPSFRFAFPLPTPRSGRVANNVSHACSPVQPLTYHSCCAPTPLLAQTLSVACECLGGATPSVGPGRLGPALPDVRCPRAPAAAQLQRHVRALAPGRVGVPARTGPRQRSWRCAGHTHPQCSTGPGGRRRTGCGYPPGGR